VTDIARLQLEVDSKQAEKGADALDALAVSGKKAETSVTGVGNSSQRAAPKLKAVGNNASTAAKKMSVMRGRAQQAGYQIQDMAVQIQGGTSAFVAFGQQGSQLAGAFGPGGAIIGAFIALGSIAGGFLFNELMKASKAMETLDDDIEELTEGFHDLTSAQKAYLLSSSQARSLTITESLESLNAELKDAERGLRRLESGKTAGRRVVVASPEELKEARDGITKISAARDIALAKLEREVKLRGDVNAGLDKQAEKEREVADKRVVRKFEQVQSTITQKGESPLEAAQREFSLRRDAIQEFRSLEASNAEAARSADLLNTTVFEAEKTAIIKNEIDQREKLQAAGRNQAVSIAAGQIGQLASIAKKGGKNQFDSYKKLAQTQAVISTAQASANALATPGVPYPVAVGLSVSAGLLGAIQVAAINKEQYQPRANGGQMKAGGSFLVGEHGTELITMGNRNANITPNYKLGGGDQPIQITNVYQIGAGTKGSIEAEIMRLAPALAQMSVNSFMRATRQGGGMSRAVGMR